MNPDFEKIKNVLAIIRRVLLSVCALVITVGVLILLRSLINAEFLRSYNSGRYSPDPRESPALSPFRRELCGALQSRKCGIPARQLR